MNSLSDSTRMNEDEHDPGASGPETHRPQQCRSELFGICDQRAVPVGGRLCSFGTVVAVHFCVCILMRVKGILISDQCERP